MKHALIIAFLAAAACTPQESPSVSRDTGRAIFAENCASCHGPAAKGSGPAAHGLKTPPADLTRIAARRDTLGTCSVGRVPCLWHRVHLHRLHRQQSSNVSHSWKAGDVREPIDAQR